MKTYKRRAYLNQKIPIITEIIPNVTCGLKNDVDGNMVKLERTLDYNNRIYRNGAVANAYCFI